MPLELKTTDRGFAYAEFADRNGDSCAIRKSSLATEDCLWLGLEALGGMHLTREMVADLLPLLKRFAETGRLAEETRS